MPLVLYRLAIHVRLRLGSSRGGHGLARGRGWGEVGGGEESRVEGNWVSRHQRGDDGIEFRWTRLVRGGGRVSRRVVGGGRVGGHGRAQGARGRRETGCCWLGAVAGAERAGRQNGSEPGDSDNHNDRDNNRNRHRGGSRTWGQTTQHAPVNITTRSTTLGEAHASRRQSKSERSRQQQPARFQARDYRHCPIHQCYSIRYTDS